MSSFPKLTIFRNKNEMNKKILNFDTIVFGKTFGEFAKCTLTTVLVICNNPKIDPTVLGFKSLD